MKVAITIPTGRARVRSIVRSFIKNAAKFGHDTRDFSLYLAIDFEYNKTELKDFLLDNETEDMFSKVEYICEEDRRNLSQEISKISNISPKILSNMVCGNGYSKQRNSALIKAILDGNDYAILIDDDELPIIPIMKDDGSVYWTETDFFGAHLNELEKDADITRGPYLGYLSPVPSGFEKNVPKVIRKKLGEALQIGNDVITKDSFFNMLNQIKYLKESELYSSKRPFVVNPDNHGKHVYAGNMGIKLSSLIEGRVPLFFTPPKARGEDTIFALQLEKAIVKEVSAYIFHDPFSFYNGVANGIYPELLESISVDEETKIRFGTALMGWIKYAPLLIKMTSKDEKEKSKRLKKMARKLENPIRKLSVVLEYSELNSCLELLEEYSNNVDEHYKDLYKLQDGWKEDLIPALIKNEKIKNCSVCST